MKASITLKRFSLAKRLVFTAAFAALCLISTLLIAIPLPNGYFNTGDVFVLLSGWCLGPLYGGAAAAIGSALADVCGGFALYAPVTFIVKGGDAVLAWLVCSLMKKAIKKPALDFLSRTFAAIIGEAFMVLGYFTFESALYGFAGGALALLGNTMQGVCCGAIAVLVFSMLYHVPTVKNLFPALIDE